MADYVDTKVSNLVINNLTQEKYDELLASGQIKPDELYCTPDNIEELLETKQDKATAVNYNNITNCITKIPQDIKLELSGGVLTLKAGSKVYVPNGIGTFDVRNITTNISTTITSDSTYAVCVQAGADELDYVESSRTYSGITNPQSLYSFWYDTANNVIKLFTDDTTTHTRTVSFPIAIVTVTNGAITSIDQVFNGFGYIGSTVFALKGVRYLVPYGRNEDGSMKNLDITLDSVKTLTNQSALNIDLWYVLKEDGRIENSLTNFWQYDSERNLFVHNYDSGFYACIFAISKTSAGNISNWVQKPVFHAVDYDDTEFIAHQAMPANRYADLTLGASGSAYTAPADGTVLLLKTGNTGQFITIDCYRNKSYFNYSAASQACSLSLQVSKGDSFVVWYDASGATDRFMFIYANGAK